MKQPEVFLFVSRNMGSGYANAYPKCSRLFLWWCERVVLPRSKAAFVKAVSSRSVVREETEGNRRIATVSRVAGRFVFSIRCEDTRCTDPMAKGRKPKFDMHAVFDGTPNLICKAFNDCTDECFRRGWDAMTSGENDNLRFIVPPEVYLR